MFFSQQWVLPFLYIASGTAFMMSKKPLEQYLLRLAIVFMVGVAANIVSDELTGRNWRGDFANTIFQMFYVLFLILAALITGPLREALRQQASPEAEQVTQDNLSWKQAAPLAVFGTILCAVFPLFIAGSHFQTFVPSVVQNHISGSTVDIVNNSPVILIQVLGTLFLCHLACLFRATDMLPWYLLLYIYVPRVFIPWAGVGFPHNFELLIFAMVVQSWKIRGRANISDALRNYWPLMLFGLLLLSCADLQGRCDLMPAATVWERLRFYGIECAFALALASGAFAAGDPYETNAAKWLNEWALFAYCFHVAVSRAIVQPYGGFLVYSAAAVFYMRSECKECKLPSLTSWNLSLLRQQKDVEN